MSLNPYEAPKQLDGGPSLNSTATIVSSQVPPRRMALPLLLLPFAIALVIVTVYGLVHLEDNRQFPKLWQRVLMASATSAYAVAGFGILMLAFGVMCRDRKSYVIAFILLLLSVTTYATCFIIFIMTPQAWYIFPKS